MSALAESIDRTPSDCVGLIIALPAEARSIGLHALRVGTCMRWEHGWATVSGIGPHNAMRAAERLLSCGVTRLANWGVAGALDPALAPGDLLIPDRVLYADGDPGFDIDPATGTRLATTFTTSLRVHRGALWSAQQPLATSAAKQALATRSGARAVDMEAAPIAAVAARARLPFVVVKAICDPLTREVPERIARTLGDGAFSWRMLAAIAFGGPAVWHATRALSHDFTRARRTLAAAARLLAA